ncbi:MAG TPA: acetyl-CoA carboxylase biotin carboxyl carrier protein [Geminicoccaceae bacterium]|nr:acetyl-CoA carboxylase biotin carboxyl carrier protein [Geminicoccaceae bacterium]
MTRQKVDTALIETLAELLQRTGLTEIELAEGDSRIRVVRAPQPLVTQVPGPAAAAAPAPVPAASEETAPAPEEHPGAVRAPMVGTVYLTPEPGAAPFITLGAEVREGQTLLIIEAMKVMNPIRAPRSGRIAKLLVTSGDPVEYGELLLIIE